jgi:hypothetical protein
MTLAFVGIVIAIALGVVALLRPAAQAAAPAEVAPQYSEQQVADAKKTVCSDYDKVFKAVTATGAQRSDDPNLKFVISLDVRLATQFGSNFLRNSLADNPASPSDVADAVRDLISTWDKIILAQIGGAQESELTPSYAELDSAGDKIRQVCK